MPERHRARVLLADNNVKELADWKKVLVAEGYQVITASNRARARELARDEIFHLAVIDLHWINQSDTTGVDLAKGVSRFTPCIILTGGADARAAIEALKQTRGSSAAVNMVMKQDGPEELLKAVEDAMIPWVFVVHGHDDAAVLSVERCLDRLGTQPIVLRELPGSGKTIIEKFEHYASGSCFAVVLLTPDDLGGENANIPSLNARARQNVIFELGFFFAKLGRPRVIGLVKAGKTKLELPSDYLGVQYVDMDSGKGWQLELAKELENAGIPVDRSRL